MTNTDIANTFSQIADILEIRGENPFRVRAYRNASLFLNSMTKKLPDNIEELNKIHGIGKDLSEKIVELKTTGELRVLNELLRSTPKGLLDMLKIPTVGPKKVKLFYHKLGIKSITQLKKAVNEGKIENLPGMGKLSAEKIKKNIEDLSFEQKRYLLSEAEEIINVILNKLQNNKNINKIMPVGSFRRGAETVGDIDILISSKKTNKVTADILKFPFIKKVLGSGKTKTSLVLRNNIQVDFRIVSPKSFGAALHYFTGSKQHNIGIRALAVKKGLKISEYGVFKKGKYISGRQEKDVFSSIGLQFIPPELREGRGEIDAAKHNKIPDLIELKDIKGDLQMHSIWSDGKNKIEDMAKEALNLKYKYIAITDHTFSLRIANGLSIKNIIKQWKKINKIQKKFPKIKIFKSAEIEIKRDGSLDLPDKILKKLDFVLVSVHSYFNLDKEKQTKRICKALGNPCVHALAHPLCRLIQQRREIQADWEKVFRFAKNYNVLLEINSQPLRLDLNGEHISTAKKIGCKFVISTDSHSQQSLSNMRYGIAMARRGWLEANDVINTYSLKKLMKFLDK